MAQFDTSENSFAPTGSGLPWDTGSPEKLQQNAVNFGNQFVKNTTDAAKSGNLTFSAAGTFNKLAGGEGSPKPIDKTVAQQQNPAQPIQQVSTNDLAPPPTQQVETARQTGTVVDPTITKVTQQISNRVTGAGDPHTGNIPAAPTPPIAQQMTQQMSMDAKPISLSMDKIPNWHDSDAFSMGLINFGMNLLSGNNLIESMNSASGLFQQEYGKEKRQIWAEDLRRQGYDDTDIQSWIQSGDNKDLKDPMERKMKIMQYNQAAANLDKSLYENSPEMRNYNMSHQQWEDQLTVQKMKDQEAQQAAQLAIQRAHLGLAQKEFAFRKQQALAKGSADQPFGMDTKTLTRVQNAVKPYYDKVMNKTSQYDMAANALQQAKALRAQGGSEAQVTQLYKTAMEAYARGMKGTMTGGISPKEVEEYGGNPSLLGGGFAGAKIALGGAVPDYELDRLEAAATSAKSAEQQTWNDFASNQYTQLARELGPERASRAMSLFSQTGTNIGGVNPHTPATMGQDQRGEANARTVQIQR